MDERARNINNRIKGRIKREASVVLQKVEFALDAEAKVTNIFDYNGIMKDRPYPYRDRHFGNVHYGMEYSLREYSGYKKTIWCASEHTFWSEETDNLIETKNHHFPVVLVPSKERLKKVKDLTDKIIIPVGPRYAPYASTLLDRFHMGILKKSLGRVIVAYPQHNNLDSYWENQEENFNDFLGYVKELKDKYSYDTVLICMYYLEIQTGGYRKCEEYGFDVVTCGRHTNYDFGIISNTLFELADLIVSQSYSTIIMGGYFNKPAVFVPGVSILQQEGNPNKIEAYGGFTSIKDTFDDVKNMFKDYREELSEEQKKWCAVRGGYSCVKSKEEMKAIFDFAGEMKRRNASKDKKRVINNILKKDKYSIIRKYVLESL